MEGNIEKKKTEPILVSRFDDIREKPGVTPEKDDLSEIFDKEQNREHFFKEAKESFEFVFDKGKFIHHIQEKPNEKSLSYLKQVRRYGLILKAAYKFADSSHLCGEGLQQFLSLLGTYNDSYWISPNEDEKKKIIEGLDNIELSVHFINTPGFKEYAKSILSEIEVLFQARRLPIKEFHTLRKRLRLFSNFMQVAAAENYGGNLHWLFYSIFKLSSQLGKHHDDFVAKGLQGEIDYHESVVEIDPHIAEEFEKLKPYIEKVCGLIN